MRNGKDYEGEDLGQLASGADAQDSTPGEFTLATEWRIGARTRAWDDLWRRLLAGLTTTPEVSGVDATAIDMPAVRKGPGSN